MPTGFVCQLHYQGGGSLLCQTSTGDSWQLPFAHAPPHVRIGHAVSFSLATDRADLAVDLEVIKEKTAKPSAHAEMGLQSIQEEATKPAPSSAKQPSRKLQRSITRFHNADLEERLQMIEAAESLFSDLLNAVELDGDAICKLLCRCAGWLHAPGSFEARHVAAEDKFDRDKFDREKLVEISVVRQVDRGELIGVSLREVGLTEVRWRGAGKG